MLITLTPRIVSLVDRIYALRKNDAVAAFLQAMDFAPDHPVQLNGDFELEERFNAGRLLPVLQLLPTFGQVVAEYLEAGHSIITGDFEGIPRTLSTEPEEEEGYRLLALELSEDGEKLFSQLHDYWEDETGRDCQRLIELLLRQLLWHLEMLSRGKEVTIEDFAAF